MTDHFEAEDRYGARRPVRDGDVLRDGERLIVGMMAFDAAPAPISSVSIVADAEARRQASQDRYEARIRDAWKAEVPAVTTAAPVPVRTATVTTEATASDSQAAYEARLRNAYREG